MYIYMYESRRIHLFCSAAVRGLYDVVAFDHYLSVPQPRSKGVSIASF
jgi:hypothetical protein